MTDTVTMVTAHDHQHTIPPIDHNPRMWYSQTHSSSLQPSGLTGRVPSTPSQSSLSPTHPDNLLNWFAYFLIQRRQKGVISGTRVFPRINHFEIPYVTSPYWPLNSLAQSDNDSSSKLTQILNHMDLHTLVQLQWSSAREQLLNTLLSGYNAEQSVLVIHRDYGW